MVSPVTWFQVNKEPGCLDWVKRSTVNRGKFPLEKILAGFLQVLMCTTNKYSCRSNSEEWKEGQLLEAVDPSFHSNEIQSQTTTETDTKINEFI